MRPRFVTRLVVMLLSSALVLHAALTVLLAGPPNPAQLELSGVLTWYQRPHFQQNWQLFAPVPINDERLLLLRARLSSDNEGTRTTEFVDITSPEVAKTHEQRLLAPKTPRIGLNLLQLLTWRDPVAERLRDRQPTDDAASNPDLLIPVEESVLAEADVLMRRYLCDAAVRNWGPTVTAVQARLVVNEFPPYSRRTEPNSAGKVDVRDLPWMSDCDGDS